MDRNIKTRIVEVVDTLCGGNKSEFCRHIGRKADAIKDIIGGKGSLPGYDLLYDILSSDLGISPSWLMLGIGSMLVGGESQVSPTVSINNIQTVNIGNWDELVTLLKEGRV